MLLEMEIFELHIKAIEQGRTAQYHKEVIREIYKESSAFLSEMSEIASKHGVSLNDH